MELLKWTAVTRKRSNDIPYDSPDYVRGYDIDMADFAALVVKHNDQTLKYAEECRLADHVRTMINIVMENPKINPRTREEREAVADAMFLDGWHSLQYIKEGAKPYSYVYRSMYTAACRYYKKLVKDRQKQEALQAAIDECYAEYRESISDGKTPTQFLECGDPSGRK